jgi:hypothetical protein
MSARQIIIALVVLWLATAYLALPRIWRRREKVAAAVAPPTTDKLPRHSETANGIPGDPINLLFVGTGDQLVGAMLAAGWHPADPITLKSSLEIAAGTVFHRSYDDAPVSPLMLWGKKQDLTFEFPFGEDPSERHHIRFWLAPEQDASGRTLWAAGATFDRSVGLSHTTGQITHHIAPGTDAERDNVLEDLRRAGMVAELHWLDGFQHERTGKNGGGDPYFTDGRLAIVVVGAPASPVKAAAPDSK